jgi:four helix bundle protein
VNVKDFRRLKVWQKAHLLTLNVYETTRKFPKEELYGLTTQMRRSSSSIPTNIAEGCGRAGDAEFARFLQIAMGSASELEYELILSRDLHYLSLDEYENLNRETVEVKRMLGPFIGKLKADR